MLLQMWILLLAITTRKEFGKRQRPESWIEVTEKSWLMGKLMNKKLVLPKLALSFLLKGLARTLLLKGSETFSYLGPPHVL